MVLYGWLVRRSKNQVNRAGELCSQHLRAIAVGKQHEERNQAEPTEAIAIIDWWRSEHAKPLSRERCESTFSFSAILEPKESRA